ncbi:AAEL013580-PA [Aedes aegypti]|uniref:AAEL013580-PA n=1 Tax=Aedes aegypti TaxID=7159 RepID=Q16IQ4_AEDAE|nr:AAEL013580-PA [Aedes aegypti]
MAQNVRKEIDFISDINDRYAMMEYELEEKLKLLNQNEQKLVQCENNNASKSRAQTQPSLTLQAARQRNFELLKSLEVSKARLRSRATFSPLETILQKAIENYLKETSLVPCTTKKAYGPTYV